MTLLRAGLPASRLLRRALRLPFVVPVLIVLSGLAAGPARADAAAIPAGDIPDARDSPLLRRYEGAVIVSYARFPYTDFRLPLSPLERTDRTDGVNNALFLPKQQKELEGELTRLAYVLPAERTPLEAVRSYQDELEAKGGEVLFACKAEECGGDSHRAAYGGGSASSLTQYFLYEADLKDEALSTGYCALTTAIGDQRFLAARLPLKTGDAYVAVQVYRLQDDTLCHALAGRTVALVHLLLPANREHRMKPAGAEGMAAAIAAGGGVAVDGLRFEADRAELTPASDPALDQVARMMRPIRRWRCWWSATPTMSAPSTTISTCRAAGPMRWCGRWPHATASPPAASNDVAAGRIRNRRVELVKLN